MTDNTICRFPGCSEIIIDKNKYKYLLCKKHRKINNLTTSIIRFGEKEGKERYEKMLERRKFSKTLDGMIYKFGEKEGKERWENYCHKQGYRNTLHYLIKTYGKEEGNRRYKDKNKRSGASLRRGYYLEDAQINYDMADWLLKQRQSTFSKEKCIEKHGKEKGLKVWNERQKKWQNTLKAKPPEEIERINKKKAITLERMVIKYGKDKGKILYNEWIKKVGPSLENMIKKYGREEGKIKYKLWKENLIKRLKIPTSKMCNSFIDTIEKSLKIETIREKRIKQYSVDCFYKNFIIEFYGDFWHCNPNIYKPDYYNPMTHKKAKDMWNNDEKRLKYLENKGYNTIVIWEKDWKENKIKTINFLKERMEEVL